MPIDYVNQLSPHPNKGVLGQPLRYDTPKLLDRKLNNLTTIVKEKKKWVALTGAGISVSSGISDFRGPNGIWTLQMKKQEIPVINFDNALPSYTHNALTALEADGRLKHLVSQNIDNLHLKSGFPRDRLVEPHGNCFMGMCPYGHEYYHYEAINSVGQKILPIRCREPGCRVRYRDTVLDWDQELCQDYFKKTIPYVRACDLLLVLGTSLQIKPVSTLTAEARRHGAQVVIVNLQTVRVNKALIIYAEADMVMKHIMDTLELEPTNMVLDQPILHSKHNPKDDGMIPQ
uniref:protein acetyllysine N-acetyltransferase n=1 Tax=Panagrellus redivivus TaxID=6233 RepID=A0A7E4WAG4_PANRE